MRQELTLDKYHTHHRYVSFAKSLIRIAGGLALVSVAEDKMIVIFGVLFIVAEFLGIIEEIF